MKNNRHPPRAFLAILFTGINLAINIVTIAILTILGLVLYHLGLFPGSASRILILIVFTLSSLVVGIIVSYIGSHFSLHPLHKIINSLNQLAAGNYSQRLHLGNVRIGHELSNSFNTLAEELENTEMLRSDFINKFSHEFKTPIVSILGFSKLLQKDTVTDEQRKEYLSIIEEESDRLAMMATNVLDLTKVENQNILTEVTTYNLSEQIRTCILLLEKKWSQKNLIVVPEFVDHEIDACEDQLIQVWINLFDNAIKFTPDGGEIVISVREENENIIALVCNSGSHIDEKDLERIFRKFYQVDTSHVSKGNGLGLAIASRITALHGGSITARSGGGKTVFTVTLPKKLRV